MKVKCKLASSFNFTSKNLSICCEYWKTLADRVKFIGVKLLSWLNYIPHLTSTSQIYLGKIYLSWHHATEHAKYILYIYGQIFSVMSELVTEKCNYKLKLLCSKKLINVHFGRTEEECYCSILMKYAGNIYTEIKCQKFSSLRPIILRKYMFNAQINNWWVPPYFIEMYAYISLDKLW